MQVNGYFKAEFPNEGENSACVVFYSPFAGGVYVAVGLSNPEARLLAFNLNQTLSAVKENA